jgi:hypothetical protein
MTRAPTRTDIDVAESRVSQSKRDVRQGVARTRAAVRAGVLRPAALGFVVVASGLSAFWVARKLRTAAAFHRRGAAPVAGTSFRGFAGTLALTSLAPVLSVVLREAAAAWRRRRTGPVPGGAQSSMSDDLAAAAHR